MSRKTFISIVACLLCLLPALTYAQSLTRYEYWFDDDFAGRVSGNLSGTSDAVSLSIGTDLLENGVHKFSFRARQSDGKYSAITSSLFLKLSAGTATQLEYWIDGDYEHARTISGELASDGKDYLFVTDLDLGQVSPGHHRLYCRPVSNSGITAGAVTSVPIIVKSKYNTENEEDVDISQYAIYIDGTETYEEIIPGSHSLVDINHELDARNLSPGEHTVKATIWNSAGSGTSVSQKFTVVKQETPSVELTSRFSDNGMLLLEFNSIPNDLSYALWEKTDNGINHFIIGRKVSIYPDQPTPIVADELVNDGSKYYIKAVYTDADGSQKSVNSNEISIDFSSYVPPKPEEVGTITGRVIFDGQNFKTLPEHMRIFVKFSDGEKTLLERNGSFKREGVPYGTKLTLTIDDDEIFTYESAEIEVKKGQTTCNLHATMRDDMPVQIFNDSHDLLVTNFAFSSYDHFDLEVTNTNGKMTAWTGMIIILATKKKDFWDRLPFSKPITPFAAATAYIKNLNYGKTTSVSMDIADIPEKGDYEFYFITQRDEQSTTLQYKELSFKSKDWLNPMTATFSEAKKKYTSERFYWVANEVDACILDILDVMKEMDKWDGPLGDATSMLSDYLKEYERNHGLDDGYFGNLPEILKNFKSDLTNAVNDVKEVTDLFDVVHKVKSFYDDIKEFKDGDFLSRFVLVTKKILNHAGKKDPFLKIYSLYLDFLEKSADKAKEYQEKLIDYQLDDIFVSGNIKFKLYVEEENGSDYFRPEEVKERISDIQVHIIKVAPHGDEKETQRAYSAHELYPIEDYRFYSTRAEGDALVLTNNGNSSLSQNMSYAVVRFWMQITWKNGRVTKIPLYRNCVDWKDVGQNVAEITVTLQSPFSSSYYGIHMDDRIHLKEK